MKRVFDFLIGLFGLIFLSPVFALISVLIFVTDGSPVVFKQERVGKDNKLFKIYKFRTMKNNTGDYATADIENLDDATTNFESKTESVPILKPFLCSLSITFSFMGLSTISYSFVLSAMFSCSFGVEIIMDYSP